MILFLIVLACLPLAIAKARGGNKLTPLITFCLSQFGGMAFALTKKTPDMTDLSAMAWVVYWGMNISFIAGYYISEKLYPVFAAAPVGFERIKKNQIAFIVGVAAVFLGSVAYSRLALGTWPIFAKDIDALRAKFFSPNRLVNLTIQFSYPAATLLAYGYFRRGAPKFLFLMLWAIIPVVFLLCSARNMILFACYSMLFAFEVMRRPIKIRWAALLGIALIVLFGFTTFLRFGGKALQFVRKSNNSTFLVNAVEMPAYVYVANNFWNLDYGIKKMETNNAHPQTWGYSSLSGFSFFVGQNEKIENYFHIDGPQNKTSSKNIGLNTISYQWTLYKDFGLIVGCAAILFIGAWCSKIYREACVTRRAGAAYLAMFASFWSGYSMFLFGPTAPQNAVYLMFAIFVYAAFTDSHSQNTTVSGNGLCGNR